MIGALALPLVIVAAFHSFFRTDGCEAEDGRGETISIVTERGWTFLHLTFVHSRVPPRMPRKYEFSASSDPLASQVLPDVPRPWWGMWCSVEQYDGDIGTLHSATMSIHDSLIVVALIAIGALGCLPDFRRRLRLRAGRCEHCGYDVRGCSELCSECGKGISNNGRRKRDSRRKRDGSNSAAEEGFEG